MRETTMKRQHLLFGLILASVGVLAACNSDSPTAPPATPTPTAYTMVLTATPGQALVGSSIVFQATVSSGSSVVADGTSVTFTVSGCVPGGATDPAFENGTCEIVRTTSAGRATATLTSNNTAGSFQVVARVPQKEASTIVTFSHPITPGDLAIYSITPNRGRPEGGEQVTIRGRGFATPVKVDFRLGTADYHAQVLSVSADGSQIQAVTPALPQGTADERIADVVVTAAAGTTAQTVDTLVGGFVFERPFSGPMIYAVTPAIAVVPGPVSVSILGSGFVAPVRVEMVGGGSTENQQVVAVNAAGTQIDILAGPTALGAGARDVRVITRAGTSQEQSVTRNGGFTWAPASIEPGVPVVLLVQPNRGSPRGGETITLYGDNFCARIITATGSCSGVPEVYFDIGSPINARRAAAVVSRAADGRSMTVRTPEASPQPVTQDVPASIVVTNESGSSTATDAFVYASEADLAIYSVVPNRGKAEGGDTVTIYGRGFISPVNVVFAIAGADRTARVLSVSPGKDQIQVVTPPGNLSATEEVIASITVTAAAGTSGEQSATLANAFTYEKPLGQPRIYSLDPSRGSWAGGEQVRIFGANFFAPVRVFFGAEEAEVASISADKAQLTVLTPRHSGSIVTEQTVAVTVRTRAESTQQQEVTLANAFTYVPDSGDPVLYTVVPSQGSPRGGEQVVLTGKNFTAPVLVEFLLGPPLGNTLPAEAVTVNTSGTQITLRTPQASPTPVTTDVPVTIRITNQVGSPNSRTATFINVFTYIGESRPPLIYYLQPDRGSARGGEQVVIHGRFLLPPVNVVFAPGGAAEVTDVSSDGERVTILTPAISVEPLAKDTPANITLTSQYGTGRESQVTLTNGFLYIAEQPTPEIYSLTPNSGPIDGGTRVTITGRGFQYPVEVTFEYPTGQFRQAQVVSVNFTTVVCLAPSVAPSEPDTPAIAQVRVTNVTTGKQSNSLPFRYGEAMFISAISPSQGSDRGGDQVTIYGQGFSAPVAVTLADVPAEPLTVGGTLILVRAGRVPNRACTPVTGPAEVVNINSNLKATGPNFTYMPATPFITSVSVTGTGASGNTLPAPGTPCGPGTYLVTVNGFEFEKLAGGASAMRGRLGTTPPIEFDTTWVSENVLQFAFPDLSAFQFNQVPCVEGGANGQRYVPTPVSLTLTNVANSCSDTLNDAFILIPCDTSCRIVTPPELSLSPAALTLPAGTDATMTVTLSVPQQVATTVTLTSSAPAVASVPASVSIPAGLTSATFKVTGVSPGSGVSITASVTLPGVTPANANVTVSPMTIAFLPGSLTMGGPVGSTANLSVVLGAPVVSPVTVTLNSSNPSAASVPSSITIAANANSATFQVTKNVATAPNVTITGTLPATLGGSSATATVQLPPLTLTLAASGTLYAGSTVQGTAQLSTAQPTATTVTLSSSDVSTLTVPASVIIPAGATSVQFTINGVSTANPAPSVTITASIPAIPSVAPANVALTVNPLGLSLAPDPATIAGPGSTVTLTVSLQPAGTLAASPITVSLSSANTSIVTVPASVTIPAGATSATFLATGVASGGPVAVNAALPATLNPAAPPHASSNVTVN